MTDFNTKKDIENYLRSRLVWDESEQCMVEINRTASYKISNCHNSSGEVYSIECIFYHPWQIPKREEKEPDTERLSTNKSGRCTCGGHVCGSHSDWCDSLKKDEDELPF